MKQRTRKAFAWLMTFAMLLSLCPVMSIPAGAETSEGYEYAVSDEKATIIGYKGSGGEITIPSKLDGVPVTAIGAYAFAGCSTLQSVTIPDSVTTIETRAFAGSALKSVTIGDSVTTIGEDAFYSCSALKSVTIGNSVKIITVGAFSCCNSLSNITIDKDNPFYCFEDGVLFSKDKKTLLCYPAASGDYTIPDSVTTIRDKAFYNCSKLTSVTIPASVKVIGSEAFNCIPFENVTFEGDVMPGMCSNSFSGISISETDASSTSGVTVDIVGFKNGKNDEIWMSELLKPVVTGYNGSDELYYRFETDIYYPDEKLNFYTSDMEKVYDGGNCLYFQNEAYAAIRYCTTYPSWIKCSVYTIKKEDGKFAATKIASKEVTLTTGDTGNFIENTNAANQKEFAQNNVLLMQQGDSATLAELLGKAGFTHVICDYAHMVDITTSKYGGNELTVNEITGGDRNTVITASETKTGLSKLTFNFWTYGCVYHGTSYSAKNPLSVTMYIYVVGKPAFQTTTDSITVIDNTGSGATSTYQIGLGTPKTTFTGLKENTEYDVLQTLTVNIGGEDYTGVYHNYVKTKKSVIDLTVTGTKVADKVYDGKTEAAVTLGTVSGIKDGDEVTVTATATFTDANVGTNKDVTVTYALSGTAAGKYIAPADEKLKANITIKDITVAITPNGGTYGGTITAATAKFSGLVSGESLAPVLTYSGTANDGTEASGTGAPAKAGSFTVTATLPDNETAENYNLTGTATADFVVAKASVEAPTIASKTYTGNTLTADVNCTDKPYSVKTNNGGTAVGQYDVVLTLTDTNNYKWSDSEAADKTLKFQITQTDNSWTTEPKIENVTYGTAINPVGEARHGTATITYEGTGSTSYSGTTAPTNAGTYKATFSVAATDDYGSLSKEVDFTIDKAKITVTDTKADGKTYDGNDKADVTLGTVAGKVGEDDVTVTVSGTFADKNAGNGKTVNLTYTLTGTKAGNYTVSGNETTFADISPKMLTIAGAKIEDKTYDGNTDANVTSVTFDGLVSGESLAKDTDYSVSGVYDNTDASGDNAATKVTVTVTLQDTALANNYSVRGSKNFDKTIDKAEQKKTAPAPTLAGVTKTVITINAVTVEGETVEYAKNTTDSAPEDGWQTGTEFSGLTQNTTYYIFARVQENTNYKAGSANTALEAKTKASSSGGGGGGGGSSSTYPVSVTSPVNGTAKTDKTSATKGSTVTITVTPNESYTVDTVTVKDASGNTIETTKKSDTTYTFTMPNSKVTVSASFKAEEETPVPAVDDSNPFTDVKESDYFYEPVLWAVDKGITSGVTATTFCPYDITTRAQMVTFLWRAAGSPEPVSTVNPFVDVKEGDYFYKAVLWGYENVYVKGTSATTFSPDLTVTRGQAVTFLARMAGVADEATGYTHSFTDVPADAYYNNSIAWASQKGIANGTGANTFAPDQGCKRGEVVTFLYRNATL